MRYIYKGGTALVQEIQQTDVADGGVAVWSLGQMGIVLKGARQDGFIFDAWSSAQGEGGYVDATVYRWTRN
jgi:hypothetical protein